MGEELVFLLLIALILHQPLIWVCKKIVDQIFCSWTDFKDAFKSRKK